MPTDVEQDIGSQGDQDLQTGLMESLKEYQKENTPEASATENADDGQRAPSDAQDETKGSEQEVKEKPLADEEANKQVSSASEREAKKSRASLKVEAEIARAKKAEERATQAERERDDLRRQLQANKPESKDERPRYFYKEPPEKPVTQYIKDPKWVANTARADVEFERDKALQAGDEATATYWRGVLREYDQLDRYDREYARWESTEGTHKKAYDDRSSFYKNKLLSDEFKWIRDPNSLQGKALVSLCSNPEFVETIKYLDKQPEGLYIMASWAKDREKALRTDALEARVKELETKQVVDLKKKAPVDSSEGTEDVESPGDEDEQDPEKSVISNLRKYQQEHGGRKVEFIAKR